MQKKSKILLRFRGFPPRPHRACSAERGHQGSAVPLTPKAFETLLVLIENAIENAATFSKRTISSNGFGPIPLLRKAHWRATSLPCGKLWGMTTPKVEPTSGSRSRVPEDSRPSRDCDKRSHRRTGASATWTRLRPLRQQGQSPQRLQRFPYPLERRRPRHPDPEASQGRVREAAIAQSSGRILAVLVRTSGRPLLSSPRSTRSVKSPSASIPALPPSTHCSQGQ